MADDNEFTVWLSAHRKLSAEQIASLTNVYNQTQDMNDIELSYSEMLRKNEVEAEYTEDNPHKRDNKKTGRRLTPAEITILEERTGIQFPTNNVRWSELSANSRQILESLGYGASGRTENAETTENTAATEEVTVTENTNANTNENEATSTNEATANTAGATAANTSNETGAGMPDEPVAPELPEMQLEDAIRLANGDLNSLSFSEILLVYNTLRDAAGIPNSPANQALEKMRAFSEQKMDDGANPDLVLSMENAPELGAWAEVNNDVQREINKGEAQNDKLARNQIVAKRLQDFFAKYDKDHELENITAASYTQISDNFDILEDLLKDYDPLARDAEGKLLDSRFEKISEFYDEMEINNDDDSLGVVTNIQLKREMADLAIHEAETELLKDQTFKTLSPEAQQQALSAMVYKKMQEGVANLISAEMSQQFNTENAALLAQLEDENLSAPEREKLAKLYEEKAQAFAKAQEARLSAQTAYFTDAPVALTEAQKAYLTAVYKQHNQVFNPDTTWNQLSDEEKKLIAKAAKEVKDLQPTEAQLNSGKAGKPEPFKTTGKTALSTLYVRTKNVEHLNKRIAHKTGFMKMWEKVKEFDRKLSKSHPKLWGFAKNFALTTAVSLTVGAPGVALIAAYKANKAINVVAKKAKMDNMGFFTYLKAHPQEAVNTGLAVGGALLSVGFAGADVMTHGLSSMGLVGQGAQYSIANGTGLTDTISEMASNFHGNSLNLAKLDLSQMAEKAGKTATSGRFLSRLGLAAGNAASVATTVYNKQRTQGASKWKAFKASLGAGLGSMTGMAVSLGVGSLSAEAPDQGGVDGISGADAKVINPPHLDQTSMLELTDEDLRDPVINPVPLPEDNHVIDNGGNSGHGGHGVDTSLVSETDKALFDEMMERNAIIARSEFGGTAEARSEFVEQQTEQDFAHYRQLMSAGKVEEANAFLKDMHEKAEHYEGEQARTPDADDSNKLTKMKLKAQKSFNDYQEKLHEAEMNPDDEKAQKALDKARMKYAKSMVDLSDREFKEMASRYEKAGVGSAMIDEIKAEREVLRHGKGADVQEVVDKKVAGLGVYEKSDLAKAAYDNMQARNGR